MKTSPKKGKRAFTHQELLDFLRKMAADIGKTPTKRLIDSNPEFPSSFTFASYFGSWNAAVEKAGLKPYIHRTLTKEEQQAPSYVPPIKTSECQFTEKTYSWNDGAWTYSHSPCRHPALDTRANPLPFDDTLECNHPERCALFEAGETTLNLIIDSKDVISSNVIDSLRGKNWKLERENAKISEDWTFLSTKLTEAESKLEEMNFYKAFYEEHQSAETAIETRDILIEKLHSELNQKDIEIAELDTHIDSQALKLRDLQQTETDMLAKQLQKNQKEDRKILRGIIGR